MILSASCGIEVARVIPYKPLRPGDRNGCAQAVPLPCASASAKSGDARPWTRSGLGRGTRTANLRTACPWRRPIRSMFITPRAPTGIPKASFATTAATRWRSNGHVECVQHGLAKCSGRAPISAGPSAVATSCEATPARGHDDPAKGSPSGRPMPGRSGACAAARRQRAVHRADGVSCNQA
jgi:hypothetical protein